MKNVTVKLLHLALIAWMAGFPLVARASKARMPGVHLLAPLYGFMQGVKVYDLRDFNLLSEGVVEEFYLSADRSTVILYWNRKMTDIGESEVRAYLHLTDQYREAIRHSGVGDKVVVPEQRLVKLSNGHFAVEMDFVEGRWAFPVLYDLPDALDHALWNGEGEIANLLLYMNGKGSSDRNLALREVIDETFLISKRLFSGKGHFHPVFDLKDPYTALSVSRLFRYQPDWNDDLQGHFIPSIYLDSEGLLKDPSRYQVYITDMVHMGSASDFAETYRHRTGLPFGSLPALSQFEKALIDRNVIHLLMAYQALIGLGFEFDHTLSFYLGGKAPSEGVNGFVQGLTSPGGLYQAVLVPSAIKPPRIELQLVSEMKNPSWVDRFKAELKSFTVASWKWLAKSA